MRISRFRIREGDSAPWYMGVAWHDFYRNDLVLLPIPLNIIAGLVRRFLLWASYPWRIGMTKGERGAYELGRKHGEQTNALDFLSKVS